MAICSKGICRNSLCHFEGRFGFTGSLTTGSDNVTGTSSDDTITALVDATTPANATLSAADTINGGSGTDTLNITTQAAGAIADALNSALVSSVETINLRAVGTGGVALAAGGAQGLTSLNKGSKVVQGGPKGSDPFAKRAGLD